MGVSCKTHKSKSVYATSHTKAQSMECTDNHPHTLQRGTGYDEVNIVYGDRLLQHGCQSHILWAIAHSTVVSVT
jgi:hypothetical protein